MIKNTYIFSFDKRMVQFCALRESITEIIRVRRAMVDPMDLRSSMDPSIESVPESKIQRMKRQDDLNRGVIVQLRIIQFRPM